MFTLSHLHMLLAWGTCDSVPCTLESLKTHGILMACAGPIVITPLPVAPTSNIIEALVELMVIDVVL